jgi:hypothetical protein
MRGLYIFLAIAVFTIGLAFAIYGRSYWHPLYLKYKGKRTMSEAIAEVGPGAVDRLQPAFVKAGVAYPPKGITLIAYKQSKELQLWAKGADRHHLIKRYPILAASGELGPKLREGDRQVPEGIYTIEYFNPNSAYHLSMKLNYPNGFDAKYARLEGREFPGSNIFIHGKAVSIGCLAMGDSAIEELFTLSHEVGRENIKVIISPTNPDKGKLEPPEDAAGWVDILYDTIAKEIRAVTT